jgi:macrodomain Ter protein organizer (MatP/YcbG family)
MAKSPLRAKRGRSGAQQKVRSPRAAVGLAPALTRQIARDTGMIASYLAAGGAAAGMQELIENVDFPEFVARLIEGTFNAAVDASIEQMKAYGDLVKDVACTAEQFADNLSAEQARDRLTAKYPELIDDADDGRDDDDKKKRTIRARRTRLTHKERRHLIAKAMLMGINRIVVTSGSVPAKRRIGRS